MNALAEWGGTAEDRPGVPVTNEIRAKAVAMVLREAEQQLKLSPMGKPSGSVLERIDAVLRCALAGGLDQRRYAALWLVRKGARQVLGR